MPSRVLIPMSRQNTGQRINPFLTNTTYIPERLFMIEHIQFLL